MNTRFRLIVVGIAVVFLAYAIVYKYYNITIYIFGLIGYLIWSHFREGTVFLATQAFHKKDYEKVKLLLTEIKNPDHLRKGRRNFYEFMLGNIKLQEGDIVQAEYHLQLASRLPWKREYEKGMVLISLANINLLKKEYVRVEKYIEVASELKLTHRQKEIITKIENELKKHI